MFKKVFVNVVIGMVLSACGAWPSVSVGQSPTTMEVEKAVAGTVRQQEWLASTLNERMQLAEMLGDDGARAMAKAKGYDVIYDGSGRTLRQGPDQVYRGKDGRVIVYEAKGGSGQLGHAYGHPQGSTEWAVESAKRVLQSGKASEVEKRAAREILEGAAKGMLDVQVIRTRHILGEPTVAVLEQSVRCSDEAIRLAKTTLNDIAKVSTTGIDDVARATDHVLPPHVGMIGKTISKVALPVAIVVDAGIRTLDVIEAENRFAAGEITSQQREIIHARNVTGMAGGLGGAWAGAEAGTIAGGAAGSVVAPGLGTVIGGVIGGVVGGVTGYIGGDAAGAEAGEWASGKVHSTGTTISETAKSAWATGSDYADSAKSSVINAWNWAWGK